MKHEQMGKYVALISKFQNNKKTKKLASSLHHQLNIGHFTHTIDPNIFRETIQQKIKNKYKEPKRIKTLPKSSQKTLELDLQSQDLLLLKKKLNSQKEEQSDNEAERQKRSFFRNGHDCSINSKSKRFFINTSNLLMTPQSNYIHNRKFLHPEHQLFQKQSKTSNFIFKTYENESLKLNKYPIKGSLIQKVPKLKFEGRQQTSFLNSKKAQTLPDDFQEDKGCEFSQKSKETLNQIVKNRSPMSIKKTILKQIVTIPQNLTCSNLNGASHHLLSKQKYNKITSHRIQKISKEFSNEISNFRIERGSFNKYNDKIDTITGWQYDQQF